MYFLTLWNARFFVVLFGCSVFAVSIASQFEKARDYSCFVMCRHLLQFKVTRRHLSLYFCQFSFNFAIYLNAQLNQFNYRNVEIFRNQCTYSSCFDVISVCGYFVVILLIL